MRTYSQDLRDRVITTYKEGLNRDKINPDADGIAIRDGVASDSPIQPFTIHW